MQTIQSSPSLQTRRVILIPYWVLDILKRNQLQRTDVLDYQKIKDIMSVNDQLLFCALQNEGIRISGIEFLAHTLSGLWADSIPEGPGSSEMKKACRELSAIARDGSVQQDIVDRLFTPISSAADNCEKDSFITYDITPGVIGIVVKPGCFTELNNYKQQLDVIRSILKILHMYETYHEVAKQPVFKRYLELLSMTK